MIGWLVVTGALVFLAGCEDVDRRRTVFVEVTSSPTGLLTSVSVGFADPVEFEATTPIARNVRVRVSCDRGIGPGGCEVVASASVKSEPAGKRITMCLTDAGERDCATSEDGDVSVTMTIVPE